MVLGFLEGNKIEITADKQTYISNDTIKGQVTLTLGKPKKAKELRIQFYGEYPDHHTHYSSRGSRASTTMRKIFEQKIQLSGSKEYSAGTSTYPFEIKLPEIKRAQQSGISLGPINIPLGTDPVATSQWYLEASLDVGMSFDVSKKMRINLSI